MELLVDLAGIPLWSPDFAGQGVTPAQFAGLVGMREVVPIASRLVWASLAQRYEPSHPPGEVCLFGMDFSFLLSMGAGIASASLGIFNNTFLGKDVSADWVIDPVTIAGRQVWTRLQGGVEGNDYRLMWTVKDTDGNAWPRSALVLCSETS